MSSSVQNLCLKEDEDDNYGDEEDYDTNDFGDEFDTNSYGDFFNDDDTDTMHLNNPEYFEFECYPIDKIDFILENKCEKLISALKLDNPFDAIFLLKQFKWNSQKIIDLFMKDNQSFLETYFSDNNNNKSNTPTTSSNQLDRPRLDSFINIFSETNLFSSHLNKMNSVDKSKETLIYCNICCTNKPNSVLEMISLDECSHCFCFDCWRLHFETLISLGTTSFFECMETKCKTIASKDFVLKCLAHEFDSPENLKSNTNEKKNLNYLYKKLVAVDLIKESDDLKLCPGDNTVSKVSSQTSSSNKSNKCGYIIWSKSNPTARRVICSSCQTQFCFLCSLPYHAPNACQTIRKWNSKCQDDSETRNYLLVHTQDCPKCNVCIEKNGGCSHMTCNRCKHEFCWTCLNDWKTHGASYDCNRYKGNPELDNAREALNRYTHYYHRWINHSNSLKFEKAFKERCQLKIQEKIMNKGGGTLVDWEFLNEAADLLTIARYTLQYTYPYAYYLESNETKLLFENIQAELERDVENLSHSLEKVNLNDKFNIKSQMSIVETRRKTLLKDFIR